ncbi:MAG: ABC transporter permease [Candidatus Babeliales bacterium]
MNNYRLFLTALTSLNRHKLRSLLTTLGIIVGIVSIISVMSIGHGAKYKVKQKIEGLGTNFIIVLGGSPKRLMHSRGGAGNLTITPSDLNAILEECDGITHASPGVQRSFKIVYEGNNWQCLVGGADANYLQIRKWNLTKGYFFTEHDVKTGKRVAIIGKTVKKELFGKINPINKTIRIKNIPFTVIGVLEERGKMPNGMDEDDLIIMPYTTAQKSLMGIHNGNFTAIIISAKKKEIMNQTANEIEAILRQQHKLTPQDENDFTVFTQDDITQASDAATQVLNILLFIIASISLIVGGIGIMNIMLVTVAERTKEIGIRMALGATTQNILIQFILEAIVICIMGGVVGVIIGVLISEFIGIILGWPIFISIKSIIISLISCIVIGLFFGFYPAKKASGLNPVEALIEK